MLKYYYIDDISKLQCGPFTPDELLRKGIQPETMIWRSGMQDWQEAGTLAELTYLFDPSITNEKKQTNPLPSANNSFPNYINKKEDKANNETLHTLPKTWLFESIIFTLICCSPVSLIGLIFSIRVETLYSKGKYEKAEKASNRAKKWGLGGILFWPIIFVVFSLFKYGTLLFWIPNS